MAGNLYHFQRTHQNVFEMQPGHWAPTRFDGIRSAYFCCPTCGNVGGIGSHTIEDGGTVTPSIVCSATVPNSENCTGEIGCSDKGFHEWVQLDGWDEVDWSQQHD